MRRRSAISVLLLAAVTLTACSRDPETAKREFLASGDKYLADKKYTEAILQYRNAIKEDARFGAARIKRYPRARWAWASCSSSGSVCCSDRQASVMLWP